ncbi:MAG: uroporphyrinogen-III synthase [Verrucomicrobiales bacterium]|jgi:uroporphyrinogen III methyltransferase/synthase|nr:uroporphyrinogen-III synthase [Verrucomicrobiales bacterium]
MHGSCYLITRARAQNGELRRLLAARGAAVVELPLLQIKPLPVSLPAALAADYRWLVFTSVNGVECFFRQWAADGHAVRELAGLHLAAVGGATGARLRALGLTVTFTPTRHTAARLCAEWPVAAADRDGGAVLHVCGRGADDTVVSRLARLGCRARRLEVYATAPVDDAAARWRAVSASAAPDWVIFCSAAAAREFRRAVGGALPAGLKIASLGPVTSAAIRAAGWPVNLEASVSRMATLVAELAAW